MIRATVTTSIANSLPLRVRRLRSWVRDDLAASSAAFVLIVIVLLALLAPVVAPFNPTEITSATLRPPSWAHWFGTDEFGRDVFSRVLWGSRLTLSTAASGVAISVVIGVPLGLLAGYLSKWVSGSIMRTMDVLLAFPGLLLALLIVTILGPGLVSVAVAIGISYVPVFARVVYGATLSTKAREYVLAAKVIGCKRTRVMSRHILPNVASDVIVIATSAIGWAILLAAALNFLGFGVQLPTAEWGADLSHGKEWLGPAWWISTFPGLAITVTIFATNYLGDWAANRLDVRATTIEEELHA